MGSTYEVADVIEIFNIEEFGRRIPTYKQKTLRALLQCRTSALGGHVDGCDKCGHIRISYNSCRNRHCPKCQGVSKEMWTIQREQEMLPVSYFHVVFTIPHELNHLCMYNPRFMYDLLFESAWYVLHKFGKDPGWLGARSGATMVLHTWGQNMQLHPHACPEPAEGYIALCPVVD